MKQLSTDALGRLRGSWVLVTGASSGIGREFARQLAVAGMNLVLVARRKALLETLAEDLRRDYGVKSHVCLMDLSRVGAAERLFAAVRRKKIRIRLLCNVAGVDAWGQFENTSLPDHLAMVRLNAETPLALCHLFREDLVTHLTSSIINIVPFAANQPVPYLTVYTATKAFILSFSQSLHNEWLRQGILVQTLMARPTDTGLPALQDPRIRRLFPKFDSTSNVVRISLQHLTRRSPLVKTGREPIFYHLFRIFFPEWAVLLAMGQRFRPSDDRLGPSGKTGDRS